MYETTKAFSYFRKKKTDSIVWKSAEHSRSETTLCKTTSRGYRESLLTGFCPRGFSLRRPGDSTTIQQAASGWRGRHVTVRKRKSINPLKPELNSICYLLALLAYHFLHVSRIRVKSLTFRRLMSYIYIYGAPILDVSRSHTTTQHSR